MDKEKTHKYKTYDSILNSIKMSKNRDFENRMKNDGPKIIKNVLKAYGFHMTDEEAKQKFGESIDEMVKNIRSLAAEQNISEQDFVNNIMKGAYLGVDMKDKVINGNVVSIDVPDEKKLPEGVKKFAKHSAMYLGKRIGAETLSTAGGVPKRVVKEATNRCFWNVLFSAWDNNPIMKGHLPPTPGMR